MIELENVVLASPEQMEFIIQGMRNPMNSWEKSDSNCCAGKEFGQCRTCDHPNRCMYNGDFYLGKNDHSLMQRLAKAGTDHRKYMRMIPVYVRITAPLYWWKEFDTYQVGVCPNPTDIIKNSCSTMHKIQEKEFTLEDFSCEHLWNEALKQLKSTIDILNAYREDYINKECGFYHDKEVWWQMIQLLPSSYNQTRNVMMNYEVLANIYKSRRGHKLDEWREFCRWIEDLSYSELIMSAAGLDDNSINAKQGLARNKGEKYSIPEETIDKINAIGNINAMSLKNIQEAINEYRKEEN